MRDYKILCDQSEYPSSLAVLPASRMWTNALSDGRQPTWQCCLSGYLRLLKRFGKNDVFVTFCHDADAYGLEEKIQLVQNATLKFTENCDTTFFSCWLIAACFWSVASLQSFSIAVFILARPVSLSFSWFRFFWCLRGYFFCCVLRFFWGPAKKPAPFPQLCLRFQVFAARSASTA